MSCFEFPRKFTGFKVNIAGSKIHFRIVILSVLAMLLGTFSMEQDFMERQKNSPV